MKKEKSAGVSLVPEERVESLIVLIRGRRVMIDADLAEMYGTTTKRMNEQVKRNRERFPEDFMFQLTLGEKGEVVANCDHLKRLKFSPNLPFAFTEHGAIMAANVLNSPKAIHASVYVVRAFIKLREVISTHKELVRVVSEHERRLNEQDEVIISIVETMTKPPEPQKRKIGFRKKD